MSNREKSQAHILSGTFEWKCYTSCSDWPICHTLHFFGYFTCICVDGKGPCVYLYACEFMFVVVVVAVAVCVCLCVGR